jgi:hypothetical protein
LMVRTPKPVISARRMTSTPPHLKGRKCNLVLRWRKSFVEPFAAFTARRLEHVSKKLLDFFHQDMLQLFEVERFLFDHVIPRDREAL